METITCPHCQQELAGQAEQSDTCPRCGGVLPLEASAQTPAPAGTAGSAEGDRRKWMLIGGAAAVVVAAGLLWVFVLADGDDADRKPDYIISAQRTRKLEVDIGDMQDSVECISPERDVLLFLTFGGIESELLDEAGAVRSEACNIIVDGRRRPGVRVTTPSRATPPAARTYFLFVTVPKDVLDMTLHVEGLGPIPFRAQKTIHGVLTIKRGPPTEADLQGGADDGAVPVARPPRKVKPTPADRKPDLRPQPPAPGPPRRPKEPDRPLPLKP